MRWAIIAAAGLALGGAPAEAQQAFAGTWRVTDSAAAPWAAPKEHPAPEPALRDARIAFLPDRVAAPIWIGCRDPQYRVTLLPAEGLFEGGLDDPDRGLRDPKGLAARLGFTGSRFPTLETRCSELSFHLASPDEMLFALNDVIYRLHRERGR